MTRFFRRRPKDEDAPLEAEPADAAEPPVAEAEPQAEAAPEPEAAADARPDGRPSGQTDADRVEQAVERTRKTWFSRIGGMFRRGLDDEVWDELEETLIAADTGVETTVKVLDNLKHRVEEEKIREPEAAQQALKDELLSVLAVDHHLGQLWGPGAGHPDGATELIRDRAALPKPAVVLVVGVNGTGKTTSIGKMAHAYKAAGLKVILAAGDTFRAAAIDQLKGWGQRAGVEVIAHKEGADPGAVAFDALNAAEARGADVVIIDTAGRLHTKANLMEELRKVNRVIQRKIPSAPHEVLLVVDATSGQNALHQAKYFTEAVGVTGVLLAKLDGTAKGGVIFAVCDQLRIPVRFVGSGEKVGDLAPFEARAFIEALFA
jgi:fused signal recognition particle receptor